MSTGSNYRCQVAIIGGGIVGLAVARELTRRQITDVVVLEKEARVASHQTGRNSGVIHSGLYYKPGSLKATLCRSGKAALEAFCLEQGIAWDRCGKIVVAVDDQEATRLQALVDRATANGVQFRRIDPGEIHELEPHAQGVAGLHVPETGITDYTAIAERIGEQIRAAGGRMELQRALTAIHEDAQGLRLETSTGSLWAKQLINCAGLHSDLVYCMAGGVPQVQIIPFRGEYYELKHSRQDLVRNLIYPVPDPAFPFLGVHFTRMIHGGVECGPNAVLALAREGYSWKVLKTREFLSTLGHRGFRMMARNYYRMGIGEIWRSLSKPAFVRALRRLLPALQGADLIPCRSGVRAQAITHDGTLVDDFLIEKTPHGFHVLNAPSPAATASLAIATHLVDRFLESLDTSL